MKNASKTTTARPTFAKIDAAKKTTERVKNELATVKGDLSETEKTNIDLFTTVTAQSNTIINLATENGKLSQSVDYFTNMRDALAESFMQEHADLMSRIQRVEGRLRGIGANINASVTELVVKGGRG